MSNTLLISRLKQEARALKRASRPSCTHCQALDAVARKHGFPFWKALLQVSRQPAWQVLPLPRSNNRVFYRIEVEGEIFAGWVAVDGPYIVHESTRGGVSLGDITQIAWLGGDAGWWLCKYEDQPRIDLNSLSDAGRRAMAEAFGLTRVDKEQRLQSMREAFYGSPAFAALTVWARKHPILARRVAAESPYLPDWLSRAKQQEIAA